MEGLLAKAWARCKDGSIRVLAPSWPHGDMATPGPGKGAEEERRGVALGREKMLEK